KGMSSRACRAAGDVQRERAEGVAAAAKPVGAGGGE
ncbi:hypothetical protein LTSESEN_0522, partial [Salmonella enterica subsp. enterica serovar Senftenberg str. A4-543]